MGRYRVTAMVTVEVKAASSLAADVIALQGIQIARELTPQDRSIPLVAVVSNHEIRPTVLDSGPILEIE